MYSIIIQRDSAFSCSAKTYKIDDNGAIVGRLGNGDTLTLPVMSGQHLISFIGYGKVEKQISISVSPSVPCTRISVKVDSWGKIQVYSVVSVQEPTCNGNYENIAAAPVPLKAIFPAQEVVEAENNYQAAQPVHQVVVHNGSPKSKWTAFFLCLFFGTIGAHKFYEGKVGMGILYLLTVGFFGIGYVIDLIVLLFRSNPYYV